MNKIRFRTVACAVILVVVVIFGSLVVLMWRGREEGLHDKAGKGESVAGDRNVSREQSITTSIAVLHEYSLGGDDNQSQGASIINAIEACRKSRDIRVIPALVEAIAFCAPSTPEERADLLGFRAAWKSYPAVPVLLGYGKCAVPDII